MVRVEEIDMIGPQAAQAPFQLLEEVRRDRPWSLTPQPTASLALVERKTSSPGALAEPLQ